MLGIWMWQQTLLVHGAQKLVEHCARAHITDIFFLAKGLAGTATFHSACAPSTSERDLLQELIQAAHAHGIRVHAWFTSACDERYKQQHPESGRFHYVRGRDRELISLTDEGYLLYMEKIIRELFRKYDVDGLHLDYIRYNHLLYGWAEEDVNRYALEGADTNHLRALMQRMFYGDPKEENLLFDALRAGDKSVLALARTRRKDVVRFAQTLTQAARSEKNSLILSAALMPEGAYEDTAFSDLHYGQNYEDAAKLFDYALPMAYSKAYGQDSQWVKSVAEGTLKRGMKTLVGLHAYEGGTGPALQQDIEALKNTPVEGICLFRAGATAMAYAQGRELRIFNPMDDPITSVSAGKGSDTVVLNSEIASGEEQSFRLPFDARNVRVFSGEQERCVYVAYNE